MKLKSALTKRKTHTNCKWKWVEASADCRLMEYETKSYWNRCWMMGNGKTLTKFYTPDSWYAEHKRKKCMLQLHTFIRMPELLLKLSSYDWSTANLGMIRLRANVKTRKSQRVREIWQRNNKSYFRREKKHNNLYHSRAIFAKVNTIFRNISKALAMSNVCFCCNVCHIMIRYCKNWNTTKPQRWRKYEIFQKQYEAKRFFCCCTGWGANARARRSSIEYSEM